MTDRLRDRAKKATEEMDTVLQQMDVDTIRTEGITIRTGNRILKLTVADDQETTIEDEMREEFREKIRERLQEIKSRLNSKITEMVEFTSQIREEAERKERELQRQLDRAVPMPDVLWNHAQRGLSVVKGDGKGRLIWFVQGIYKPLFVDSKPIDARYAKKLITPVVFVIRTDGKYVKGVSTRKPLGLGYFSHYHQSEPDCWGNWKWESQWKTPDDIINIARQGEAVLENVNTGSIAKSEPRGLPRLETLKRHVPRNAKKNAKNERLGTDMERIGVGQVRSELGDVWET